MNRGRGIEKLLIRGIPVMIGENFKRG